MHGVPKDLPVHLFHMARLVSVSPLDNICYFTFERGHRKCGQSPRLSIGIEGRWQVTQGGSVIADGEPIPSVEDGAAALAVIGEWVTSTQVRAPRSFLLTFGSGHQLEVFDSNSLQESFSIPEANIYI